MAFPALGLRTCILASLCLSMSVRSAAEDVPQCRRSFHRETPPLGFHGDQLQLVCHSPSAGEPFATLYNASCGLTVFSAFRVGERRTAGQGDDLKQAEEDDSQEDGLPTLASEFVNSDRNSGISFCDKHAQTWNSLMLHSVQHHMLPSCRSKGGDVYMITGTRNVDPFEKDSKVALFWSAVCCGTRNADEAFSLAVLSEHGSGMRALSMGALEELVGARALFPGGCGEVSEAEGGRDIMEALKSHMQECQGMKTFSSSSEEQAKDAMESHSLGVQSTGTDGTGGHGITSSEEQAEESVESHSLGTDGRDEHGTESEPPPNAERSSLVMYLLSSFLHLLSAPVRPVVSTLSHIPGQVTYMLQEELVVLSALPCDTFRLVYDIFSDAVWAVKSAGGLVLRTGGLCASYAYACSYLLMEELINTCTDGAIGVGTLAGDGVGILADVVDGAWSVSMFVGGTAWEQSEGYFCAVFSELGSQIGRVGAGMGKLVMKGGRGVTNIVRAVGWVMAGGVDVALETLREAFGNE